MGKLNDSTKSLLLGIVILLVSIFGVTMLRRQATATPPAPRIIGTRTVTRNGKTQMIPILATAANTKPYDWAAIKQLDVRPLVTVAEVQHLLGEPVLSPSAPKPGEFYHLTAFIGKHSYLSAGVTPRANARPLSSWSMKLRRQSGKAQLLTGVGDQANLLTTFSPEGSMGFAGGPGKVNIDGPFAEAELRILKNRACLDIELCRAGPTFSSAEIQYITDLSHTVAQRMP